LRDLKAKNLAKPILNNQQVESIQLHSNKKTGKVVVTTAPSPSPTPTSIFPLDASV